MRDIKVLCVTPLSSFVHFVYKCHFASAADAPSPSDFVCHLSWLLLAGLQKPLSPKGKARVVRNCFAVNCFTAVGDDALGVPQNLIKKAQNISIFLAFLFGAGSPEKWANVPDETGKMSRNDKRGKKCLDEIKSWKQQTTLPPSGEVAKSSVSEVLTIGDKNAK